jgi:hypothetical protein
VPEAFYKLLVSVIFAHGIIPLQAFITRDLS